MIWINDSNGNATYFNKQWYEFTGLTYEQSVGAGWLSIIHPDDAPKSIEKWQQALDKGKTFHTECRLRDSAGEYRWFIERSVYLKDDSGNVVGWFGSATDIQTLKKSEEVLRKSEDRLQRMLNIPMIGVQTFDYEGNMLQANNSFLQMVSYNRNEFEAEKFTWRDFTPPEYLEASEKVMEQLRETDRGGPYEKEYFRKDGSKIWLMFASADLKDGTLVEYAIDITDRKKAEEALHQSEERLRTLADAVPQIIWTNNADGKANYFNQRWYEYSGLTYQQSEGLGWQLIVHPDDARASVEKWKEALFTGKVFDTQYRLRSHDGNYCWFIGRNVPLQNDSGKITGWFGTATDIDNLKKTEEALSKSEERLRITMESAADYAIITMNSQRKVEKWSRGAEEIFGYTEAEMIGQPGDIIFTEEDRKAGVPQQEMKTARDTSRAPDERWHQRKDGSRFFASGVMRSIQSNELTGYVKVLRDVTQQQLFTEELHRLVAERTVELKRSNEDLRQFAHVASHDLKEPIRKIQTFNNRILDEYGDELPARAKTFSEKIGTAANRMISMIEGVLRYSKLGSAERVWEEVNLAETIQHIITDLEVLVQQKQAVITTTDLPTLRANRTLLYQLFYNLILNSLKFAKEGEPPLVSISFEEMTYEENAFTKITVSDNGIGFEPEFSNEIFKTFTRLHPAEDYEGTGLGLALCKKIVERHKGSISATGEPGVGATFTILLPLIQTYS